MIFTSALSYRKLLSTVDTNLLILKTLAHLAGKGPLLLCKVVLDRP
jgi:hypothetical protein